MNDRITIEDAVRHGYCVKGIRKWHRDRGRSFRDFVKNGLPMDEARGLNDAMVNDLIRRKEKESSDGLL